MQRIDGGVNAPKGYEASGIEAGIKYENRKDMALVFSTEPANVAGTFTTNVVKAAPVQWDKEIVESGHHVRAVVLNSGIANAATGKEGKEYNYEMASEIAKVLGIVPEEVLTASHRSHRDAASYGTDPQRSTAFERCPDNGPPGGERCSQSHYDDGYDSERMCRYV